MRRGFESLSPHSKGLSTTALFFHLTPLSLIVAYGTGSDLYAGFLNIGFTCGCIIQNDCGLSTHCISLSNH